MRRGALVALGIAACGARPAAPKQTAEPARLELRVDARDARDVRVEGRFVHGGSAKLALPDETLGGLKRFEVRRGDRWVALDPRALDAPECANDCTLRYAIDLAATQRSFEGTVGVGDDAFVAPTPTWMAHPDPMPPGVFDVVVDGASAAGPAFAAAPFATGMRRRDATHFFEPTGDYWEGSFAAFGKLRHRTVRAAGSTIEIVLVSATPLALSDDQIAAWIESDAACVAQLYRRFPVPRATIFVVPVDGASDVVFGKVLSMGGASILALTGTRFPEKATRSDWVLVHEMTHLGFPTMGGVRWLTEGLATYYEPLLRARAGWLDPRSLWAWFLGQMPRGVDGAARGLAKGDSIDDTYWGGALFLLLADVGIREATGGAKTFDDVLRAVLDRGGDATVAWTLPEVLAAAREATGTRVVEDLVQAMVVRGERVDVGATLGKLGVRAAGKDAVALDDAAPDAAVRRAIERGH